MSSILDMLNAFNGEGDKNKKKVDPEKAKLDRIAKVERAKKAKIEQEARDAKIAAAKSTEEAERARLEAKKAEAERIEREAEEARLSIEAAQEEARPKVTFVMTACGRPDLMEKTLDTFMQFNTHPIERWIITEDSTDPQVFSQCKTLNDKKYNNKLEFVFNEKKLGQARSIDLAYSMVDTDYVFHCEEDWEFYDDEFIEQSLSILEADKSVLQAWIRPKSDRILNDIKEEVYQIGGIGVRDVLPKSFMVKGALPGGKDLIVKDYMGFSWNPGLKRMSDYKLLKNGYSGVQSEHMIDSFYRTHSNGFKVVSLSESDDQGFVRHIGWGRRADDPIYDEDKNSPQDLEQAMLEARQKREADKKRVEAEQEAKQKEEEKSKGVLTPKISVVMQVYLGDYPGSRTDSVIKFHRAVKSFVDQNYQNSELIIASDGCELTKEHYYEYYANEKRIKFVFVDKTGLPNMYDEHFEGYKYYRGVPREAGRALANGELITYMDSDDVLHPTFLYKIIYHHNLAPSADWMVNMSWFDHIAMMGVPLSPSIEPYDTSEVIKVPFLGDSYFVKTKVKEGLAVNTPWLLTHKSDVTIKWIDTLGQVSEDVAFSRRLREKYKNGYTFNEPTYLRCHYTGLWDV